MQTLLNSSPSSSPLQTTIPLGHLHYAIIDIEDYAILSKYHWSLRKSHSCWYAIRKETVRGCKRTVFMHRQIMNAPPDLVVHHQSANTLDNRRSNLLLCTHPNHVWIHAQQRILKHYPLDHSACVNFLASRGITTLCTRPRSSR